MKIGMIASVIENGGVVALCDHNQAYLLGSGLNESTVERIIHIRGTEHNNPFVLYASNLHMIKNLLAPTISYDAYIFAEKMWPSSLMLVLNMPTVPANVKCGMNATGVCCPTDATLRQIIALSNQPCVMVPVSLSIVDLNQNMIDLRTDGSIFIPKYSPIMDARGMLRRIDSVAALAMDEY